MQQPFAVHTWLAVCLVALWLLGGCGDATATPPPPVPSPASQDQADLGATAPSATEIATRAITASGAAAATPPVTRPVTLTAALTAALPVTLPVTDSLDLPLLVLSETLRVRSGPGITYPIVASLPAGAKAAVTGRSSDGQWWRIVCPPEAPGDQCWLIGDPLYSALDASAPGEQAALLAAIALATAGPPPTLMPTPAPTPCIATALPGWSAYRVRSGDTLSSLAARSGGGVASIQTANCLASDLIIEGDLLYLPGMPAAGGDSAPPVAAPPVAAPPVAAPPVAAPPVAAPPVAAPPVAAPPVAAAPFLDLNSASLNQALADLLDFSPPGSDPTCIPQSNQTEPSITVGSGVLQINQSHGTAWRRGQLFGICWNSIGAAQAVTFTVTPPTGVRDEYRVQSGFPLRWTVDPADPIGLYTITTTAAAGETASFSVEAGPPPAPTIVIFSRTSNRSIFGTGEDISFVLSGYPPGDAVPLFVCNYDGEQERVTACLSLSGVQVDASGLRRTSFSTQGLSPGFYGLHDGSNPNQSIKRNDPRTFFITDPDFE